MLSYRKFDKESDYSIMHSIVQQNCAKTGHLYPQLHVGNLDFERYTFEKTPDILYNIIWFISKDKKEIGFIAAYEDEFYFIVLPGFEHLAPDILDYLEQNCYTHGISVTTDVNSEDKFLNNLYEQRGYTKTDNFRFNGICELSKIEPCPPLPEGYIIRLTQKKDIERRVELYGLAAGGRCTTSEGYVKMMNSPSYKYALDLVVQTEEGEVIAYCTVWDDPYSKIGILEPVACVAEYRRKGIMKSTLLYGMNQLKERGTKYMYVGTGGTNIASQALYKSVGFIEHGKNCVWQKTL